MSKFPATFGRGNISQDGRSNSLAEEIMRATMESASHAMDSRTGNGANYRDEMVQDTYYYSNSNIESSDDEDENDNEDIDISISSDVQASERPLLPSEQPLIPFEPARLKKGERAIITPEIQAMLDAAGVEPNPKYQGEITAEMLNDLLTPEDQNCALHITNIHPKAEMKDLFPTIHHGKVYSVAWNSPNGEWTYAASRLCFCTREAAERYLEDSETGNGISICGQRITVEWNRNKKCPVPEDESHQSRVIQLRGPRTFGFSANDLEDFFGKDMKLNIISRKEWDHRTDQKVVELAFCGIKAQSRMAFRCFKQKVAAQGLGNQFDIRFAPDHCDPNADQGKDMFMPRPRTSRDLQSSPPPPRTLESIRTSNWRTGTMGGPKGNGSGKLPTRGGPKYEKGAGPNVKSWRRAE
ncbi:hypothetical protein SBOR_9997 [Sclerotinia borealis F-4128]|uniref:Uncharacterized protein n=1 Tax=Sclerotinia borealis (strain F-4128) TaxID=1432307 RepID=W9C136_SCLBF|nr:hypothetical protein SBOR_9997 [Sclerotinia borealis F-4128]